MAALQLGPVPADAVVMHTCDVPSCVNPAHLRIATHADNEIDKDAKGRRPVGELHGKAKLTEKAVRAIYEALLLGECGASVGKRYGVKKSTVYNIAHGNSWKHLYDVLPTEKRGRLQRLPARFGESASWSVLTEDDVLQIRARAAAGELQKDIAVDYDVHVMTIGKICRRERWKHI